MGKICMDYGQVPGNKVQPPVEPRTGGTKIRVYFDPDTGDPTWELGKKTKQCGKTSSWDEQIIEYLCVLQKRMEEHMPELPLCTEQPQA